MEKEELVKFEYRLFGIKRNNEFSAWQDLVTRVFDSVGVDGWELVAINNDIAFFKRPLKPEKK